MPNGPPATDHLNTISRVSRPCAPSRSCLGSRAPSPSWTCRNGYASERYRIHPGYLVAVDPALGLLGLLAALLSVQRGHDTYVVDVVAEGRKPETVRGLGASYFHVGDL